MQVLGPSRRCCSPQPCLAVSAQPRVPSYSCQGAHASRLSARGPLQAVKQRDVALGVAVTDLQQAALLREREEVERMKAHQAAEDALIAKAAAADAGPTYMTSNSMMATKIRPLRPFFVMLYLGLSGLAMVAGYLWHPFLLKVTAEIWGIKPSVDDFESSFFGLLSIIYSVFAGQTFLFLFERQINMVQELYGEVFALELLVQQTFLVCHCPDRKREMASAVRQYLAEEVYTPEDMQSPFLNSSAYMRILKNLTEMKGQGVIVTSLVDSCKQLADAQSRRSAMAAQIVPQVHWVFMHGMEAIFVFTFLIFDASELDMMNADAVNTVPEERRLFFGALFGLLALTTQVLKDLDDPLSGIYAFRSALDERTEYLESLLNELETMPPDYVPDTVQSLQVLGLIDSHDKAQGEKAKVGPGVPLMQQTSTLLRVPVTGARRRRGRITSKGFKWSEQRH